MTVSELIIALKLQEQQGNGDHYVIVSCSVHNTLMPLAGIVTTNDGYLWLASNTEFEESTNLAAIFSTPNVLPH